MKAPEKIYLFNNPVSNEPNDRWLSKRSNEKDIEYIRTDAFIDEVCEWVKKHYIEYAHNRLGQEYIIKDLREAMEE